MERFKELRLSTYLTLTVSVSSFSINVFVNSVCQRVSFISTDLTDHFI